MRRAFPQCCVRSGLGQTWSPQPDSGCTSAATSVGSARSGASWPRPRSSPASWWPLASSSAALLFSDQTASASFLLPVVLVAVFLVLLVVGLAAAYRLFRPPSDDADVPRGVEPWRGTRGAIDRNGPIGHALANLDRARSHVTGSVGRAWLRDRWSCRARTSAWGALSELRHR